MEGNIAVLGAGAIGGSIAAYLAKEGYDITVIDHWAENVEAMKRDGLKLTDVQEGFSVRVRALHLSEVSPLREKFDVVFLAVKSYDTVWAAHFIEPYLKPGSFVLPAQNGMNDETVASVVGYNRTVGCVPVISVGMYDPGHVIRTDAAGLHAFHVGELSGALTPRAEAVADALNAVGPSDTTSNIWGHRWAKMAVNCMGNAVAGLIGADTSSMTDEQQETAAVARLLAACEVVRVAQALGITVEPLVEPMNLIPVDEFAEVDTVGKAKVLQAKIDSLPNPRSLTPEEVARLDAPFRPSLLQDVMKGRPTEVAYLNGHVARKGKEVGVPTPANQAITDVMSSVDSGERPPSPSNVDLLAPYLPR